MSKSNHVHKLKRHTYATGSKVYFCISADCSYKVGVELALGKRNICHRCGNEFTLNEYSIRLAKPHCDNCHIRKEKPHATVPIRQHEIHDSGVSLRERLARVNIIKVDDSEL